MKLSREYLAGLFDGEGCVHIPVQAGSRITGTPTYGIRAIFSMCDERLIKMIADQYGVSYCRINKSKMCANWRDAYTVQMCADVAANFLKSVLPHLFVKQEEAMLAILLQEHIVRYRNVWKKITPEEKEELIAYREGLRQQIKFFKRRDVSIGMAANSANTQCPVNDDAEGQRRAKLRSV